LVPKAKPEPEFLPLIPVPRGKPKGHFRLLLVIAGVVLIVAGALLGLVPGAPGVLLGIPGLFMIGIALPPVGRWINRQDEKLSPKWRKRLRPKLWRKARRKVQQMNGS
jgi:hypothetical protein